MAGVEGYTTCFATIVILGADFQFGVCTYNGYQCNFVL